MSDPDTMDISSQQINAFMEREDVRRALLSLINLRMTIDRCEHGNFQLLNDMLIAQASILTDYYSEAGLPELIELDCDPDNNNNNNSSSRSSQSNSTITAPSVSYPNSGSNNGPNNRSNSGFAGGRRTRRRSRRRRS